MATITANQTSAQSTDHRIGLGAFARFALLALAPLALFGGTNYAAEAMDVLPLFFSPAGLPGWVGAAIHLFLLFSVGAALGIVAGKGRRGRDAVLWGAAFIIGMVAFPYLAGYLDSFALAVLMSVVLFFGLATSIRIARLSGVAAWLMVPAIAWIGFGAALGLAMSAAWSPPFALVNAQNPTPTAA